MRLACLDLPALPLQLAQRRHPEWRGHGVVVVDRDSPRGIVLWANEKARASGVLPGLRYAAGLALDGRLRAVELVAAEITSELSTLTSLLQRFSPSVEALTDEPGVFFIDAEGMLRLYPTLQAWAQAVRLALRRVQLEGAIAVGHDRFGTYATARALAGRGQVVWTSRDDERLAAERVALHRVGLEPKIREALAQLGVHTTGQLAQLPEAGLLRRFGAAAHRLHQQARGVRQEPLTPAAQVQPLATRLDFDDPVGDHESLLFFGKQLLDPLMARLHARGEALCELSLTMETSPPVTTTLRPAVPTLEAAQLLNLLRLRLERLDLPHGARALALEVRGHPATREQLALFVEASTRRDLAAGARALARVRAALGDDAVVRARLRNGHLPEGSFTWEPIDHLTEPRPHKVLARPLLRRLRTKPLALPPRPAHEPDGWMPRGLSHGPVSKLTGPFMLSGGWWRAEVQRDYYYAELSHGSSCFIYYDRVRRRWFLHAEVD